MSAATAERAQALYRFFDRSGDLLYVGVTMNPSGRWAQHREDKPWWTAVASITVDTYSSRAEVEAAEKAAIQAELPRHNRAHHPDHNRPLVRGVVHDGPCVAAAEIGAMLDVSRQRVYQLTSRRDFPEPMARLNAGAVWRTEDVAAWADKTGRKIHE